MHAGGSVGLVQPFWFSGLLDTQRLPISWGRWRVPSSDNMSTASTKELPVQQAEASTSGRQVIHIHGTPIPADWLIQRHDSKKYPSKLLMTEKETQKLAQDRKWAQGKEQWIAIAAAGVHLALFAYNLAFWGSEGMPPDRYWPANSRLKMGIKPGRYGNLDGSKRIWYENLGMMEGF